MEETIHILVVDDEADIREIVRILLESRGYSAECAADGKEAIEYVAAHPEVDLVVMDIMMPNLSGVEATRAKRWKATRRTLMAPAGTITWASPFPRRSL